MADSDDEYNSHNTSSSHHHHHHHSNGMNNNGNNSGNGGPNNAYNSNNNSNKKNNREKFYRERDESGNNSNNNNNNSSYGNNNRSNNNESRRDWNNDRSRNDAWKNNRMNNNNGNSGNMNQSSYGYNNANSNSSGGGYQRMGGSNNSSDNQRKYASHNSSPGNYADSSPPPYKRNRKDWDMGGSSDSSRTAHQDSMYSSNMGSSAAYQANYNPMNQKSAHFSNQNQSQGADAEFATQPPFLSFKLFLQQQEDNITDEDSIKRYNEYKMDFKKTQINNFFLEHKEEEWFKSRYHPDENFKRRNEHNQYVINRLDVFMELMSKGWLENLSTNTENSKELIRFLDAVVIKLEGGSDADLKILDGGSENQSAATCETETNSDETSKEIRIDESVNVKSELNESDPVKLESRASDNNDQDTGNEVPIDQDEKKSNKKLKSEDSGSESGAYSDDDDDPQHNGNEHKKKKSNRKQSEQQTATKLCKNLHKTSSIFMRNLAPSVNKQDLENLCKSMPGFKRVALSDPTPERGFFRRGWITFESEVDVKKICWSLQKTQVKDFNPGAIVNRELTSRIRPIANLVSHHKSVIKNDIKLAMKIIENMDKRWNLWQEDGANDESSGSLVERDIDESDEKEEKQPMDSESTETANLEKAAFSKLAPNGLKFLPHRFQGANPVLNNITDYLVDETNAEEEEFLGESVATTKACSAEATCTSFDIEIDKNYNLVLDKLILYLRVVHSIDFYNSVEYQQEDSMPNRCGIMFVRPALPINAASASLKISQDEIAQYTQQFQAKMKPYLEYKEKIDVETAKKLGVKDRKEEVEKFIKTNTQELAPDRWLCPLSGKKFKGPEFIRKHLFYKHMDKINEVKKEIEYFNNYVYDPKRPQLPEHPSNKPGGAQQQQTGSPTISAQSGLGMHQSNAYQNQINSYGYMSNQPGGVLVSPMSQMAGYGGMQNKRPIGSGSSWQTPGYMSDMMQQHNVGYGTGYGSPYQQGAMGGVQYGFKKPMNSMNRGRGRDSREMIQYKDLDAPEDN